MKFKINRRLLPIKFHYLLLNGAVSGVMPILPVYAKELGITAMSVGAIYTLLRLLILLAKTAFGAVADKFSNGYKLFLMFFVGFTAATMFGLCFLPRPLETGTFSCEDSEWGITVRPQKCSSSHCALNCTENKDFTNLSSVSDESGLLSYLKPNETTSIKVNLTNFQLSGDCHVTGSYQCLPACSITFNKPCDAYDGHMKFSLQFWAFSILVITGWISFAVSTTLSDAACYNVLQDEPHRFGRQRMFGSIGWGLFAATTGYLNDIFSDESTNTFNYSPGFYTLAILLVLDEIVVVHLDLQHAKISKSIFKDVGVLLVKPRIHFFLFGVFFNGAFIGFNWSYLFWHLRTLGASQLLLGITTTTQCFVEVPFFLLSGWIIRKLGHMNAVSLAFLASALRFVGYSNLGNPWWTLLLEFFQGPAFAMFYSASTSYAKVVAPEGTEATMQGLVGGTFEGLGVAAGSLLGGVGFGFYDGRTTFFIASIIAAASGIVHATAHKIIDIIERRNVALKKAAPEGEPRNEFTKL